MNKWFLLLFSFFLLTGCVTKQTQPPKPNIPIDEIKLEDYFPQSNKTYSYRGEGNEYASFKETFYNKTDSYLPSIVENGGTRILRIYQLTDKGIYLVYEQPEFYDETIPLFEELKKQFKSVPLIEKPLKAGNSFNHWKIKNTDIELNLAIGKLTNVIVVEQQDEENKTVSRSYWAPGIGKVKQEFLTTGQNTEGNTITSELEEIK